jgi:tape measure domain-containing protein
MSGTTRTASIRINFEGDQARRGLERLGADGQRALQQVESAATRARPSVQALATVTDGLAQSMGRFGAALSSPTAAIAGLTAAAGGAAVAVARIGDSSTEALNRLSAATGSVGAATTVYRDLTRLAQQTGVAVSESAGAFVRFAVAARQIGATNAELVTLVRTIQQAGIVAGASTQDTQSALLQLGQALASGKLQGDELRSVLESMPTLAEAIARELGVSVGQLRQMGSEGQLTSERVFGAILRASERINQQFEQLTPTMGRAFSQLGAAMTDFVSRLDNAVGLSAAIARNAQAAAQAVSGLSSALFPTDEEALARRENQLRRSLITEQGRERAALGPFAERIRESARAEQARIEAELREVLERRNMLARNADEQRQAEEATAASRRAEAQRQQTAQEYQELRDKLDRERKLREEHANAIRTIEAAVARDPARAEEAERLRELADQRLSDGLRALERSARSARTSGVEPLTEAQREYQQIIRQLEAQVTSTLTEEERRARVLERLNDLAAAGGISEQQLAEARAAVERATAAAQEQEQRRAAQRAAERAQQEVERFERSSREAFARIGENALDRIGQGLVSAFLSGERAVLNFGSLARSVLASVATDFLRLAIVNPISNALFGGARPTLGGALGGATAVAAASGGEGGVSLLPLAGLGRLFGGGSFLTTPGVLASTGVGFLDRALNIPLFTPGTSGAGAFGGFYAGTALPGEAGFFAGGGGSALPFTLGNALGAGASMLGGAYGIYSGIRRGGIGGAVQGLGGIAGLASGAGMLAGGLGIGGAVGGALAAAAPVLGPLALIGGIVGSLLPGQRPSGREQGAIAVFGNNEFREFGHTGRKFSPEQRAQAVQIAQSIAQQEDAIASRLGFSAYGGIDVRVIGGRGRGPGVVRARIGDDADAWFERPNTEAGLREFATDAAAALFRAFQVAAGSVASDRASIARNSSGLENLQENLSWFETTYQTLGRRISAFQQQMEALTKPFDEAIAKARQLGLAEQDLVQRRSEAVARLAAERDLATREIRLAIMRRADPQREAELSRMIQQAANDREVMEVRDRLEALGQSAEYVKETLDLLRAAQERERQQIERARGAPEALAALNDLRTFARGLTFSEFSPLRSSERYRIAAEAFQDVSARASRGDASAITELRGVSQQFLAASRDVFGSGAQNVRDFEAVTAALNGVAALSEDMLTGSFFAATLETQVSRLTDQLQALRAEIRQLSIAPARMAA